VAASGGEAAERSRFAPTVVEKAIQCCSRKLFDTLKELHGDKAAWKLVDANPELVNEIQFDLPFPEDINTREDFERLDAARLT
jgi:CTP:molybdopterin cytidylyltransferase MocA